MKMKKSIFTLLAALTIIFTGCGENKSIDKSPQKSNSNSIASINNSTYIKTSQNVYSQGFISNTKPHWYFDFATMKKMILCSKPNCTHNSSDCISNVIGDTPIIHGDYIYYFTSESGIKEEKEKREYYIKSSLNRCSLDSSNIEKIVEFTDCVPRDFDGCALTGDTIYFCGDDMNPTEDEYGNILSSNVGGKHYFCSIDLSTREYTNHGLIYNDKQYSAANSSSTAKVTGVYNSQVYIEYSFLKEEIPQTAYNENFDARDYFTILNFTYDLNTGELKQSELPSASFMNDDSYLYSNYPDKSSTLIYGGETFVIKGLDVEIYGRFVNKKIFMNDCWYDINDSSKHTLGKYKGWNILSFYDDSYIVSNSNCTEVVKLTEDELLSLDKD